MMITQTHMSSYLQKHQHTDGDKQFLVPRSNIESHRTSLASLYGQGQTGGSLRKGGSRQQSLKKIKNNNKTNKNEAVYKKTTEAAFVIPN